MRKCIALTAPRLAYSTKVLARSSGEACSKSRRRVANFFFWCEWRIISLPEGKLCPIFRDREVTGLPVRTKPPGKETSRTRNCHCAAYIRIARKGIHFMSYSLINSVPSPAITSRRLTELRVCFQWTIRKAVAWSSRYKSWRTKYHTARRLVLGVPCFASSGL